MRYGEILPFPMIFPERGYQVNDSAGNIMAKVYDVRGYLDSIGIYTPVSTVHTWVFIRSSYFFNGHMMSLSDNNIIGNPIMCGADFAGANAQYVHNFLSTLKPPPQPSLSYQQCLLRSTIYVFDRWQL